MPPKRQEQQHLQMLHDVEAPAIGLNTLLQSPEACQLLQQLPPAVLTPEQYDLLASSDALMRALLRGIKQQRPTGRMLGLLLRHQAVHSAGTLMAWVQQRPEQLQFGLLQQRLDSHGACELATNTADVWVCSCECLVYMSTALAQAAQAPQAGCSTSTLAAAMLPQLEQSGGHLACAYWC
jgi:hypothetical protein